MEKILEKYAGPISTILIGFLAAIISIFQYTYLSSFQKQQSDFNNRVVNEQNERSSVELSLSLWTSNKEQLYSTAIAAGDLRTSIARYPDAVDDDMSISVSEDKKLYDDLQYSLSISTTSLTLITECIRYGTCNKSISCKSVESVNQDLLIKLGSLNDLMDKKLGLIDGRLANSRKVSQVLNDLCRQQDLLKIN